MRSWMMRRQASYVALVTVYWDKKLAGYRESERERERGYRPVTIDIPVSYCNIQPSVTSNREIGIGYKTYKTVVQRQFRAVENQNRSVSNLCARELWRRSWKCYFVRSRPGTTIGSRAPAASCKLVSTFRLDFLGWLLHPQVVVDLSPDL